jgi:hypothetical protein
MAERNDILRNNKDIETEIEKRGETYAEQKPGPSNGKKVINKEAQKVLAKQKKKFEQLEISLNKIKEEKSKMEAALSDPATYADKDKFLKTENEYQRVSSQFEKVNAKYESAFEKMMQMEAQITA